MSSASEDDVIATASWDSVQLSEKVYCHTMHERRAICTLIFVVIQTQLSPPDVILEIQSANKMAEFVVERPD